MAQTLKADKLRSSIEMYESFISDQQEKIAPYIAKINDAKHTLRRLKASARSIVRKRFDRGYPRVTGNIEWYVFDVAVKYGVVLEGDGWFLLTGKNLSTPITSFRFFFKIDLDDRTRRLIKEYMPTARVRRRGHELVCSDVKTALVVTQLIRKPKLISFVCRTTGGSTRKNHSRVYKRFTTRALKIARYIEDKHGQSG